MYPNLFLITYINKINNNINKNNILEIMKLKM